MYKLFLLFIGIVCLVLYVYLRSAQLIPRVNSEFTGGYVKNLQKHPRSKSEAAAIKILEDLTGADFPTVVPKWLVWQGRTMELDGYNEQLKLALEFSGPLHTKWTPSYESYEKYFTRIVRDVAKRKICKKRGVNLIVLDMSMPRPRWRQYLLSRLADFGMKERAPDYIPAQKAKPFRNKPMERELGLTSEWKALSGI